MADGLGLLHEAIDGLAELDLATLDDAELHRIVVSVQQERARLGAMAAELLGRWDARKVWAGDGSRSAAARLSRETACAPATAAVEVRRARQMRSLPATSAAIERAELSLDHIDLLGRANATPPGRAARPRRSLPGRSMQPAPVPRGDAPDRVLVPAGRRGSRSSPSASRDLRDDAHLHASATTGGYVVLNGVLDPIGGAAVLAELARLERDLSSPTSATASPAPGPSAEPPRW